MTILLNTFPGRTNALRQLIVTYGKIRLSIRGRAANVNILRQGQEISKATSLSASVLVLVGYGNPNRTQLRGGGLGRSLQLGGPWHVKMSVSMKVWSL